MEYGDGVLNSVLQEIGEFFGHANAMRSLVILVLSVIAAYILSSLVARFIVFVAGRIATHSDTAESGSKAIRLRRIETYLGVANALIKAVIVGFVAFFLWQALSPAATLSAAAIGAGAFFIVIASATIGMILRDITAGSAMIIERWFNVGDFIRVEPFIDVSGVVEKVTLRSTKLRNLNGEVVWLHNQHMQGVKVTEGGVRTFEVDIFTENEKAGKELIQEGIGTMPVSPLMVTEEPTIARKEQWAEDVWLFTVTAKTPPGREWLIEDYFVGSLKRLDENRKTRSVLIREPIVRYADPNAERSFRRAVLTKR